MSGAEYSSGYGKYLIIWIWLILLLIGGTFISSLPISRTGITLLILLVSAIKAGLVTLFYMHLKSERIPLWIVAIFPFFLIGLSVLLLVPAILLG
jgi:cytochrome c oxidase subunit IV